MHAAAAGTVSVRKRATRHSATFERWKGVYLHASIVALAAALLLLDDPVKLLYVVGTIVVPAFLWIGITEMRRAPLRLSPISFLMLWNTMGTGLSGIYMGFRLQRGDFIDFSVAQIPPGDVAAGYVVFMIGTLALHVGLQWMRPETSTAPVLRDAKGPKGAIFGLAILWSLGLLYTWEYYRFGSLGTLAKPLSGAGLAAVSCLVLMPRRYFGIGRLTFVIVLAIGTAGLFFSNLNTGSKAAIMFSFLPVVWMGIARPETRRALVPALVGVSILYFVVVAPSIVESRAKPLEPGESPFAHVLNSFHASGVLAGGPRFADSMATQVEAFLMRQGEFVSAGFLVGEVRKDGYRMGETLAYAKYAFIPRILWPDKPNVSRGAWFTTYLGSSARESEATTSTGMTAVGEWYWNFGPIGAFAGMLVSGLLLGLLWRMVGDFPVTEPVRMVFYVLVTVEGMIDLPEAITVLAGAFANLLIYTTISVVMNERSKRQRQRMVLRSGAWAAPVQNGEAQRPVPARERYR